MPYLIVGLGNPGPDYADTRHNVGFMVIDALSERLRADAFEREGNAEIAWGQHKGQTVALAKPHTYMNRSGDAVWPLMQAHDVTPAELLVVVDDVHLDVGQIRLRPAGSSGGHNGLAHIQQRLGTTQYPRLRIGIGSDYGPGQQAEYVLEPFTAQQRDVIDDALIDACNAALTFVREDLETAMNRFN
jgi:PTH1 family peptidyl-tRNA hydrolase